MTDTPQDVVAHVVNHPVLPVGDDELFVGFGVMGLPFTSGHYLALRQFAATTFAPAYRSVWHRDPAGAWTFYATTPAATSCARYFSSATPNAAVQCDIDVAWRTPWSLRICMPGLLQWTIGIRTTIGTRLMTAIGGGLPVWAWTTPKVLELMSRAAGPALGAGRIRLTGVAPNGQHYMLAPKTVWAVDASHAVLRGHDLGAIGPLPRQARLGDFRLPQRGIAVVGDGHFETFDVARHVAAESV